MTELVRAAARVRVIGQRLIESLESALDAARDLEPRQCGYDRALIAEWEYAWRAFEIAALAAQEDATTC